MSRSSSGQGKTTNEPQPPEPSRVYSSKQYVLGSLFFEVDSRYAIKTVVGKGAYGLVCAAEDSLSPPSPSSIVSDASTPTADGAAGNAPIGPEMVAVKKIIDPFHDHTDSKRLLREVRLLRSLSHPNVLHLRDIMPPSSLKPDASWKDVYLVTRLYDTNLHRVIYSGQPLTDAHVQYILWQIFRALRYLHAAGVVHRDMKPTNILLNRDCELALADFGLARYMPQADSTSSAPNEQRSKSGQLTKYVVTRWYRAPELLVQNRHYDDKVDLWSIGCILAEVLGASALFPGKDSLHQLRIIIERLGLPSAEELGAIENEQALNYIVGLRPQRRAEDVAKQTPPPPGVSALVHRLQCLYPKVEANLIDLLSQLLQFDPRKRPSAVKALEHPYLAAYREAPEENLPKPEIEMDFEKQAPSKEELRQLVWQEVTRYHPELAKNHA